MPFKTVLYDIVDDVAVIKMNQPDTLNAMTQEMGQELLEATWQAEREARAMLIGAVGRGFCSGANLGAGGIDVNDPARDMGGNLDGIFNPIVYQMRSAKIPVVTAVRGAAAGVGCGIALAGDLIVAGEGAFFFQAFCKVGLAPDGGSAYLLTRAIGRPRAMEMMLLGDRVYGPQAMEWGLVNRVVPDEEVDDAAFALAKTLAQGPASLGIIKRVAWAALDASFETSAANERVAQREAGRTDDFAEGVSAFRDKRKPEFKGR